MIPFDPRNPQASLLTLNDLPFTSMVVDFSSQIIDHLAFAPSPHSNRAWLLNEAHTSSVSLCGLDFYFHYDNQESSRPQTTAIWIRVLNQNGCNVWLRVQESKDVNEKKVEIYSNMKILCGSINIDQEAPKNYSIPFLGAINQDPYFKTHPIYRNSEKGFRSDLETWQQVINEMRQLLPCACTGIC